MTHFPPHDDSSKAAADLRAFLAWTRAGKALVILAAGFCCAALVAIIALAAGAA